MLEWRASTVISKVIEILFQFNFMKIGISDVTYNSLINYYPLGCVFNFTVL